MRIAVDARPLSYPLTGIGVYLKNLLNHIQRIDGEHDYYLISNAPIHCEFSNPRWRKIEGSIKKKLLSSLWMQIFTPFIAVRLDVDLFWGPRHHLPYFLPRSIRTVLTVHDLVSRRYPETMALPNRLLERLLLGPSVRRADCIITVTHAVANEIQSEFSVDMNRIVPIHLGPPVFPATGEKDPDSAISVPSKYFLCVGTLDPRKNLIRILEAFKRLPPHAYGVHLVIVGGKGWKNKAIHDLLREEPLLSYVHLTGYVPADCLASYYRRAICLVFPSLYEGFGLPVLEAMALGTPVITSDISSMKEVAGNASLLIDPFNVAELAEAMRRVAVDSTLKERLRERGFERAKQFSWDGCARNTLNVLNRFAKKQQPGA